MLYIRKNMPPKKLTRRINEIKSSQEWKEIKDGDTKNIRAVFDQLPKEEIRQSLLEEQHYLCAYCMRKIKNNGQTTTIEHLHSLSKNKEEALEYKNMLGVCDGGRNWKGNGKRILCCDACKADEDELSISPLNKQQMDILIYDKSGFIKTRSKNEALEKDINETLCLNGLWKNGQFIADTATGLVKGRKDTYLIYERWIKKQDHKGKCTSSNIMKKIRQIENAEQRPEFAGVLLYFLNKKYDQLVKQGK
jgi:uncharacterized protein (TIGR02646 family)